VSRAARHGARAGARTADLQRRLELVHTEFARLEREYARLQAERDHYRRALRAIADAESGAWGRQAHDALQHPPHDEGAA
jgi:hypothetical protein